MTTRSYRGQVKRRALLATGLLVGLAGMPVAHAAGRAQEITWHGKQIKMYDAQPAGHQGSGVVVAVIDSWIDRAHPDFEGRALAGADCTSGSCVAGETRDACTHGTHVAGTVGSSSFGVAPKATILPVRVLTSDGKGGCTGRPADVAAGIRWATAHGARVMNLSLGPDVPGLSSSSEIPAAVTEAANAGVVVVFSAGNADLPVAQAYGQDALVVAATGPSGRLASYSQHGEGVSVAAPGGEPSNGTCTQATCITSLYPGGQYAVAAGTSMAAPHVSGIAALLVAQNPHWSAKQVRQRISATAHPLAGAGAGLVDARAALGVRTAPRPTPTTSQVPVVTATHQQPARTPLPAPRPVATATRPVTPTPSATASATPTFAASPTPSPSDALAAPQLPGPSDSGTEDQIPAPLALLAGVLVIVMAVAVGAVALRSSA